MKKKMRIAVLLIIVTVLPIGLYQLLHPKLEVAKTETYTVLKGDTIWEIASRYIDENVDVRDYIDLIYSYNDNLTPYIKEGQVITIPMLEKRSKNFKVAAVEAKQNVPKLTTIYTPLRVPNINSSFKTWMNYKAVTNERSPQYKIIHTYGWSDSEGFMRANGERDLGINDDYYLVALGSYYGTAIGTKYRITLDTGKTFYGVLADCKADMHTNSTHQYAKNKDVVEFLVDASKLNKDVKRMGSANVYMPLNGSVTKIERIDFVYE